MRTSIQPKSVAQLARLFDWTPSDPHEFIMETVEERANDWQDMVVIYGSGSDNELRIVLDPTTFRTLCKSRQNWWPSEPSSWTSRSKQTVALGFGQQMSLSRFLYPERELEELFQELVQQWRDETSLLSSMSKKLLHPAYFRIIGLGRQALPLLLRELEDRPTYWFAALEAISGENPVPLEASFSEAVDAWLLWGRRNGYIA